MEILSIPICGRGLPAPAADGREVFIYLLSEAIGTAQIKAGLIKLGLFCLPTAPF